MITRDELLACRPPTEDVQVNGHVYRIRGLTLGARQEYHAAAFDVDAKGRVTVKRANVDDVLLLHCLIGADDAPLLQSVEEARGLDPLLTDRLAEVARRLSGLEVEEGKELGKD